MALPMATRDDIMTFDLTLDPAETVIIIKDFIKTYVSNAGLRSVVLGLSGGIDSAVVAVLCKETLGKNHTHCLFLPDTATPESDRRDVQKLVDQCDLSCESKDITELVSFFLGQCVVEPNKLATANVKARIRMVLLFEYSNMTKSLVCGTSNKSELLSGYFTKYGDGGVDIMPFGDVYKTQVWQIAQFLDLPKEMISKPPTAGLLKGQTDEKELGLTYNVLDQILYGLERKLIFAQIVEKVGCSLSDVDRVECMRSSSQHKRHLALIPKIGLRTPGLDWRSPVLKG
jgi:NAD+ synthase